MPEEFRKSAKEMAFVPFMLPQPQRQREHRQSPQTQGFIEESLLKQWLKQRSILPQVERSRGQIIENPDFCRAARKFLKRHAVVNRHRNYLHVQSSLRRIWRNMQFHAPLEKALPTSRRIEVLIQKKKPETSTIQAVPQTPELRSFDSPRVESSSSLEPILASSRVSAMDTEVPESIVPDMCATCGEPRVACDTWLRGLPALVSFSRMDINRPADCRYAALESGGIPLIPPGMWSANTTMAHSVSDVASVQNFKRFIAVMAGTPQFQAHFPLRSRFVRFVEGLHTVIPVARVLGKDYGDGRYAAILCTPLVCLEALCNVACDMFSGNCTNQVAWMMWETECKGVHGHTFSMWFSRKINLDNIMNAVPFLISDIPSVLEQMCKLGFSLGAVPADLSDLNFEPRDRSIQSVLGNQFKTALFET